MFSFHLDKDSYFRIQRDHARAFIIPFIEKVLSVTAGLRVLEVGCGEGGVLAAFLDRGCYGTGVELSPARTAHAQRLLADCLKSGQVELICANIYDESLTLSFSERFDLIVLKDVVEHIPDQRRLLRRLAGFLSKNGILFFGFPPWQMPFGGHQQICQNPILAHLPYYHLLPAFLYRALLKAGQESENTIKNLMDVKATGLSIEQFERYVREAGLQVAARELFLINPIYLYKFGWQPRVQFQWLSKLPYVRNFFTTAAFYVVSKPAV
ncbi:MAG: class I SAM-dependent methyltransferase [Chitinophagales bacterium]|nr:class I SAM-dependent methyltransferase [Chitinophagales bacterium]MDW8427943.1 methyltransferase domain-containing protein [Chitinophagales bacterium]